MKKIVAMLLALCFCIGLCACEKGNTAPENNDPKENSTSESTDQKDKSAPEKTNPYEVLREYLKTNDQNNIGDSYVDVMTYVDSPLWKGNLYITFNTEAQNFSFAFFELRDNGLEIATILTFNELIKDARIDVRRSSSDSNKELTLYIPKSEIYHFCSNSKDMDILDSYVTEESGYGLERESVIAPLIIGLSAIRVEGKEYINKQGCHISWSDLGFVNFYKLTSE